MTLAVSQIWIPMALASSNIRSRFCSVPSLRVQYLHSMVPLCVSQEGAISTHTGDIEFLMEGTISTLSGDIEFLKRAQ